MSEAFTFDKADRLAEQLEAHDTGHVLFDGRTATQGLKLVVEANKSFGPAVIVFDGQEAARQRADREAQYELF